MVPRVGNNGGWIKQASVKHVIVTRVVLRGTGICTRLDTSEVDTQTGDLSISLWF